MTRARQLLWVGIAIMTLSLKVQGEPYFDHVPSESPRTWILDGEAKSFREFCGESELFKRIRNDFDRLYLDWSLPEEPETYGDPDPRKRTPEKVVKWHRAQNVCNEVATVTEAATLLWRVTGEEKYLEKAQEFLLGIVEWGNEGVTNIDYNDEAHFRLWRKLPQVYDQLRETFTSGEKSRIIDYFEERGNRSIRWIREHGVESLSRNSVEREPSSHAVRFMAMTGVSGLALWDDIDSARDWYAFAYEWYRDIFTPWGGDDGGWAEGAAYWRGVYEHAVFQDALLLIEDPIAYDTPFWRNTGYFQAYFVQPYATTQFGDTSNAGKFNMEPGVSHFLNHLGDVLNDGYIKAYAELYDDPRPLPNEKGLEGLYRVYPTATEYLLREYVASRIPATEPEPLNELPSSRYFADIGWVAFHSDLGNPEKDIHLSFKSSPYGSFSHSHADQNAFILNAFGKNLAINSGYREYHRSKIHKYYTRQTTSKNALLIDTRGQDVQNKEASGRITHYERSGRIDWARGDARVAYQTMQPSIELEVVTRDVVFVDETYFVIRDRVEASEPVMLSWQLHAEREILVQEDENRISVHNDGVWLNAFLRIDENSFTYRMSDTFPFEVDSEYQKPAKVATSSWLTAPAVRQYHLTADTDTYTSEETLYALLYPTRSASGLDELDFRITGENTVEITGPDGGKDVVTFLDEGVEIR